MRPDEQEPSSEGERFLMRGPAIWNSLHGRHQDF